MALTAKKVYAILKHQISDMEAKLNSPVRYRGTVTTADLLPLNPDIGDMYNIESKSIYGEAGMNVAWNGVVWDTMGAPIDMSLYLTKEGADTTIQNMVNDYLEKNPVKPGATTEQAQQIEQNKTDVASLKEDLGEQINVISDERNFIPIKLSFSDNVGNDYCGNKVDYIFILLGINSLYGTKPFASVDSVLDSCKNLLRKIHADLPNTKILLSTNNLISQNGGLGFNYNAQTYFGQYDVTVINHLIFSMNKAYYTLETDTEFMQYVEIINTHAQFDADNAFPITAKNVNTRSGETESIGTNGVHPTNNGYWQIADAEFRALLAN